jgi:hypothetical protein
MFYTSTFFSRLLKKLQFKLFLENQQRQFFFDRLLFSSCLLFPSFSFGQYTPIPDANFEKKLIDGGIDSKGTPTDGWILTADAAIPTTINIFGFSIAELTGTGAFIKKTKLYCSSDQLISLDVRNGNNTKFLTIKNSFPC